MATSRSILAPPPFPPPANRRRRRYEVGINLKKKASQDRHSRFTKRLKLDEGISDIAQADDQQMLEDSTEVCDSATESGTSVQTDLCMNEISSLFSALSFANAKLYDL
ncbi:hypothetical protein CBL_02956 [Carabus blaptoides fortunei]